jgi:hypothetical protein
MEAIPEGEQVLTSSFSLNGYPIVILFDSGATHDFISKAYTQKYQSTVAHTHTPYMISTPGGNIITKQVVLSIPLNLARKLCKTSLIFLDGQGIDLILGMSWMKEHKALLDTATRTVQLSTLDHGIVTLQLSSSATAALSVQHATAHNLEDISVTRKVPNVFLDDLLDILPDQDVEFTIELHPGTIAISR